MEYKYKYFDKWVLWTHLMGFVISLIIVFIKGWSGIYFLTFNIIALQFFIFIFFSLPMLVLLKNYKAYNENLEVKMDLNGLQLNILNTASNTEKLIPFEDILRVYKVYSYNRSFVHFGYMDYFYFELVLKNGESEIITCLINEDLDKYISQSKVKKVSKFFPYIKYSVHEATEC